MLVAIMSHFWNLKSVVFFCIFHSEKYKTLYDSESDEELPTTAKKHPWKTKPRTLLTPEDDEWKNSSPKHKPPVYVLECNLLNAI